jgi:hypothetical protein
MTIDDNVDFLNEAKKFYEEIANNPSLNETIKTYFTIESLESAINIMRKYQKIEKIVAHWACCGYPSESMIAIKEVIEDDNSTVDNSSMRSDQSNTEHRSDSGTGKE